MQKYTLGNHFTITITNCMSKKIHTHTLMDEHERLRERKITTTTTKMPSIFFLHSHEMAMNINIYFLL